MRRRSILASMMAIVVLAIGVALLAGMAKAQPSREMGGPAMGARFVSADVSSLWAQLSFEIKVSDEQLLKLRPVVQSEFDSRKNLADKLKAGEGFQEVRDELMQARRAFVETVKEQLTEEQREALDKLLSALASRGPGGAEGRPMGGRPQRNVPEGPTAR